MGGAGNAIVFVCLFVLLVITSIFYICFAGRAFFVVVQQTAAGTEEVAWPDEPLFDWIGQGAQFVWLVGVWFCPVAMVLRVVNPDIFSDDPGLFLFASGLTLWFLFPIGALSTMSAGSRWVIFHPMLVVSLVRMAPITLAFYVVSSVPIAAALAAFYGVIASSLTFAPLAGALGAAALLIYSRLLGRVAWKLNHLKSGRRRKREKPQKPAVEVRDSWGPPPAEKRKKKKRAAMGASSEVDEPIPLAAPDVDRVSDEPDDEPEQQHRSEAVKTDTAADDDEFAAPTAYDVRDPEPTKSSKSPVAARNIVPDDLEHAIAPPHDPDKPPPLLLVSGVFEFPWLPKSAKHWFFLTIIGTIVAGVLHLAIEFLPR